MIARVRLGWMICLFLIMVAGLCLGQRVTVDEEEALEITLPSLKTSDIRVRDPFILVDQEDGIYILYAQKGNRLGKDVSAPGVEAYLSQDLDNWRGPVAVLELPDAHWARKMVWAPEVHKYQDNYFLFVTLTSADTLASRSLSPSHPTQYKRGTQIFYSDSPLGPFLSFDNKPATPPQWMALDGTLLVEDGIPYMIFCHEWAQTHDGTVELVELKSDLSQTVGESITLFKATDAKWVRNMADLGFDQDGFVTDGPFFYRTQANKLLMIWSSFGEELYAIGLAESESGGIKGPWKQLDEPLFPKNGGHGMIFNSLEGNTLIVLHQPNDDPNERMVLYQLEEAGGLIRLK